MFGYASLRTVESAQDKTWPILPNRYEIERKLGGGGGGSVYLAYDATLERNVAIKTPMGWAAGEVALEAKSLAKLQHSNIPQVHDVSDTLDDRVFISMEYIDGEDILSYCNDNKVRAPLRRRIEVLIQVCSAVHYVHSLKDGARVHRDIRIANVMVSSDDGNAKLMDFGMSSLIDHALDDSSDLEADEEADKFERGTEADLYAIGIIAWQLLTGLPESGNAHRIDRLEPAEVEQMHRGLIKLIDEGGIPAEFAEAARTTPAKLQRKLQGDLGYILTKLIGCRGEQYSTAAEAESDLRCFHDYYPLKSKKVTWREFCVLFAQRNPVLTSVASSLSLALLIVGTFFIFARGDLATARSDLSATQDSLSTTQEDLSITQEDLQKTEQREDVANNQLADVYRATNPAIPTESLTRVPGSMMAILLSSVEQVRTDDTPFSDAEINKTVALVDSLSASGRHAEAEREWEKLHLDQIRQHGERSREGLLTSILLAASRLKNGKLEEALTLTQKNVEVLEELSLPLSDNLWLWNAHVMAGTQYRGGHYEMARDIEGQVLELNRGRENELWADASHQMALAELESGRAERSLEIVAGIEGYYRGSQGEYDLRALNVAQSKARILDRLGRSDEAIALLRATIKGLEDVFPDGGRPLDRARLDLGTAFGKANHYDESVDVLQIVAQQSSLRDHQLKALVEIQGISIIRGQRVDSARSELLDLIEAIGKELRPDSPVLSVANSYVKQADEKLQLSDAP